MLALGICDAHMDDAGYVYGTIPANCAKDLPVYGLIAHMDTSPDASGANIRAKIVRRRENAAAQKLKRFYFLAALTSSAVS